MLLTGLALLLPALLGRELGLRDLLTGSAGSLIWRLASSMLLIAGLLLIARAHQQAEFVQIWVPPWAWRSYSHPLTLAAFVMMSAAALPLSFIRVLLGAPFAAGLLLWALAHLISNGDLVSMILFGSVALMALLKLLLHARQAATSRTRAAAARASAHWDIAAILLGSSIWVLLLLLHGYLFGIGLDIPL